MAKGKRGKKRKVSPSSALKIQDSPKQDQPEDAAEPKKSVIRDKPAKTTAFFHRLDWIAGLLTALISFGVYMYTLAPDVTLEDSGELAVGSMYAGVPHPPGYPMWTI